MSLAWNFWERTSVQKIFVLFASIIFASTTHAAEDIPYHHLALFLGYGVEEKKSHDEDTFAVGLEYEYRYSERWGVGAVYETLGEDSIRNHAFVVPLSLHVGQAWRIFLGPGYEWHDESNAQESHEKAGKEGKHKQKDKFLMRLGAGYEFSIGGHWSVAPEVSVDALENGDNTWLAGVAIGFHF
jgi:Outer membrane protein beta-barrel domain